MKCICNILFSLFVLHVSAQIEVAGLVMDKANYEALEYVQIKLDDTGVTYQTDANGSFSFVIPEDEYKVNNITFSIEGYLAQTVPIHQAKKDNVILLTRKKYGTQTYQVYGVVKDELSGQPLEFASMYNPASGNFTNSDTEGHFEIEVQASSDNTAVLRVDYIGYENNEFSIQLDHVKKVHTLFLSPSAQIIDEVTVVGSSFKDIIGVPVSMKTTSAELIQINAGGGGDFTKLMQSLPGLTTINAFRNDLIVRGGSPTENTFFIDDIEIPYINHLSTQGSTGGTISILNSQQLQEVDFIASGYPANRPDAMSGVFNIYLSDPFKKKEITVGNDPTNVFLSGTSSTKNTAVSVSLRKSYRELILKQLGLAVLPNYSDFLVNMRQKLTDNSYLGFLLVGSIDDFTVNQDVSDSEIQQYLRDNLPTNQQSSFTTGLSYKNLKEKSSLNFKLSYSRFNNAAQKNNLIDNQEIKILDYSSYEDQITGQLEMYQDLHTLKIKYGIGSKINIASYDVINQYYNTTGLNLIDYDSDIMYNLSYIFLQTTFSVVPDKFQITLHNTFQLSNVRSQGLLSSFPYPRLNGQLSLSPSADFNFSVGQYSQLPENILLSYREDFNYVNLDDTEFIKSFQVATGFEFLKRSTQNQLTVEGFFKSYYDYPFNTRENISLANFGADFGVLGNVPIDFIGKGRAYGVELFFKRTNTKHLSGWISYAISKSEFQNSDFEYIVSSWDATHILNAVVSYRFNDDWSVSLNAKYQSPLPYTPFDVETSSIKAIWDVNRIGIRNFSQLNQRRGKSSTLLDLRIQRQLKWASNQLTMYFDLENILADADSQQVLVFDRDEANLPVINDAPSSAELPSYRLKEIQNAEGVFIPSFGVEFKF